MGKTVIILFLSLHPHTGTYYHALCTLHLIFLKLNPTHPEAKITKGTVLACLGEERLRRRVFAKNNL